jgi:hypothetical protein
MKLRPFNGSCTTETAVKDAQRRPTAMVRTLDPKCDIHSGSS